MNTKSKITLALVAGVAVGAIAVQGLHAQAKPKAYVISELEPLDAAVIAGYVPKVLAAQRAAGARPLGTAGGKIVALEGTAPKRVAITEYDNLEKAEAFYNSKAWTDLAAERNKGVKTIKRYAVEVVP
jgi:uncharacterized protein (DUF1330 family)